jgi:hypothetical protein
MSRSPHENKLDRGAPKTKHTRQRHWSTGTKIGASVMAAAAGLIVAVVSVDVPSASPSPAATLRNPIPTGTAGGAVPAGTKLVLTEAGVRFSLRVRRAGWEWFKSVPTKTSRRGAISINKSVVGPQGAEAILFWTSFPEGDYADPCAPLLSPRVGSSAAALADAVATAPGTKLVKGPSDVTVGGHPAKHVVLTVRKDADCDPGFFYSWKEVFGGAFWRTTSIGDTIRVWIVSAGGRRIFIGAESKPGHPGHVKEMQQVVESIRFA